MKRLARCVLSALAAPLVGCVHTTLDRNAPGHVDLRAPPAAWTTAAPERPVDPGTRAVVVHASALGGAGSARNGSAFADVGGELAITPQTTELGSPEAFQGPRGALRANLGWMALRHVDDRNVVGPSYAELQYTRFGGLAGVSAAAGAAWEWRTAAAGPQATLCAGAIPVVAICARGSYLFGEGAEIGIRLVGIIGLTEWVWSR